MVGSSQASALKILLPAPAQLNLGDTDHLDSGFGSKAKLPSRHAQDVLANQILSTETEFICQLNMNSRLFKLIQDVWWTNIQVFVTTTGKCTLNINSISCWLFLIESYIAISQQSVYEFQNDMIFHFHVAVILSYLLNVGNDITPLTSAF